MYILPHNVPLQSVELHRKLPLYQGGNHIENATFRQLAAIHEQRLLAIHQSTLLDAAAVRSAMGFRTGRGFRNAARFGRLPFPTFFLPGRRGRFARVADLASWLASIDVAAIKAGGTP